MDDTVLVLTNDDVRGLVGMEEAIELVEEAYADLGHNNAQVINRRRLHIPLPDMEEPTWYFLNVIPGAVLCQDVAAVRLNSRHVTFPVIGGQKRKQYRGGMTGLVMLWQMSTRKLLAIVQDEGISPLRVGATSGGRRQAAGARQRRGGRHDRRRPAGGRPDHGADDGAPGHQDREGLFN